MHGKGELKLEEGGFYIGEFKNGFPNGQGIRKWNNGDLYEGSYLNGFQHGEVTHCFLFHVILGDLFKYG